MHLFTFVVGANQSLFFVQPQRILSNGGERNAKNNETVKQQQTILVRFLGVPAQRRGETGILKPSKKQTYHVFSRTYQVRISCLHVCRNPAPTAC